MLAQLRAHSPRYRRITREAQEIYSSWAELPAALDESVHPVWADALPVFRQFIQRGVPHDFLHHPLVRHLLYRTGFGELERAQLAYLQDVENPLLAFARTYSDPWVGKPVRDCELLGISTAALNKLYNIARIQAGSSLPPAPLMIEFGGGYGLLSHLLRSLDPKTTYVIIDLPELLALQFVVLRASSQASVKPHLELPLRLERGATNLVPSSLMEELHPTCDVFVSTFALSETPVHLQRLVADKGFFGASKLYLVGQSVEGDVWKTYAFEDMSYVREVATQVFTNVRLEPFPVVDAWELLAWDPK